jgi:hydroxyethylthiazole kinase-like sugar kinase family protein
MRSPFVVSLAADVSARATSATREAFGVSVAALDSATLPFLKALPSVLSLVAADSATLSLYVVPVPPVACVSSTAQNSFRRGALIEASCVSAGATLSAVAAPYANVNDCDSLAALLSAVLALNSAVALCESLAATLSATLSLYVVLAV